MEVFGVRSRYRQATESLVFVSRWKRRNRALFPPGRTTWCFYEASGPELLFKGRSPHSRLPFVSRRCFRLFAPEFAFKSVENFLELDTPVF